MSIKIENVVLPSPAQMEAVIRGMRNPMNSWDKSDSGMGCTDRMTRSGEEHGVKMCKNCMAAHDSRCSCISSIEKPQFIIGKDDLNLMKNLVAAGSDHAKFMRMITVYADITAPLYWWKEYDTYKVGTVANSCSTMHKIGAKEFTLEDFSCEHFLSFKSEDDAQKVPCIDVSPYNDESIIFSPNGVLECIIIPMLNNCRDRFLETKDKKYWWQMIQLLPSSYNQRRTVELNYEVLRNMCRKGRRLDHKLDEWREFCKLMIETLPGFKELIEVGT